MKLDHKFVKYIPKVLKPNIVYISIEYKTCSHLCCCGCGMKVVTPLSPTDWEIRFNGKEVSLYPSIGNWSFECRSHYWIKNNSIKWAYQMSENEIEALRKYDRIKKNQYFGETKTISSLPQKKKRNLWKNFLRLFYRR